MKVTVGDYGNQTVAVVDGITITARTATSRASSSGAATATRGEETTVQLSSGLCGHFTMPGEEGLTRQGLLLFESTYKDTM